MSSRYVLFAAAAAGTVVGLKLMLQPRSFRIVMFGFGAGSVFGGSMYYLNSLRKHSIAARHVAFGITAPKPNFNVMKPLIYSHLSQDYLDRGELDIGEESLTVAPNVFAQIGILDVEGVRQMWRDAVLPALQRNVRLVPFDDSASTIDELERKVVFCDVGSGVGNVCLQVLAETHCNKTVGVEVIPSRIRAARMATTKAHSLFADAFAGKEAVWLEEDLTRCAQELVEQKVNVIFTHSWMFDEELMHKLSSVVVAALPTVQCVITSRRLDEQQLKGTRLKLTAYHTFSTDWNEQAPFYVYTTSTGDASG